MALSIPYVKMHGCRNDYLFVDNRDARWAALDWPALAKRFSPRKTGIGADGIILVEAPQTDKGRAFMRMYNADGSQGKMCGNGIRCVAKLLAEWNGGLNATDDDTEHNAVWAIETLSGLKTCRIIETPSVERFIVEVNMGRPSFLPSSIPVLFDDMMVLNEDFEVLDRVFQISCVSMGNPHCIIRVSDLDEFPVEVYGPVLEKHEVFPEGVNIEFIEVRNGEVFQRTWERGSGETLACGSGASAVGVILILAKEFRDEVLVHLRGGQLRIRWDGLRDVWMTGEAVTESSGYLTEI